MYAEGIDRRLLRMQGLNLSGGSTNAVEICRRIVGMPDSKTLLTAFNNRHLPPVPRAPAPQRLDPGQPLRFESSAMAEEIEIDD